jgi:plastocyanin
MKYIDDWGFYLIIGAIVAVITTLVVTNSLPEKAAAQFNTLTDVSIDTDYRVIKQPSPTDNTFEYAINKVAAESIPIAEKDPQVKEIMENAHANKAAVTIAAVQPTVYEYKNDGKLAHSGSGMLVMTVNNQIIDNQPYFQAASFDRLNGEVGQSQQQVWNIMVDLDKGTVTNILQTSNRVMTENLEPNTIYIGMNMFLPNTVRIVPGTTINWINTSEMPHNIAGVYRTMSGKEIPIDSGFMDKGRSWKYTFGEEGTLEYYCTIHSQEGMKGSIIVAN